MIEFNHKLPRWLQRFGGTIAHTQLHLSQLYTCLYIYLSPVYTCMYIAGETGYTRLGDGAHAPAGKTSTGTFGNVWLWLAWERVAPGGYWMRVNDLIESVSVWLRVWCATFYETCFHTFLKFVIPFNLTWTLKKFPSVVRTFILPLPLVIIPGCIPLYNTYRVKKTKKKQEQRKIVKKKYLVKNNKI